MPKDFLITKHIKALQSHCPGTNCINVHVASYDKFFEEVSPNPLNPELVAKFEVGLLNGDYLEKKIYCVGRNHFDDEKNWYP